ncbi:hypothetical protein LFL97_32265 [Burkholderia sp. JSH-S8]|nr:hypothetical protein LFL97_32265 [Burkholderia sp. JSH-S8]
MARDDEVLSLMVDVLTTVLERKQTEAGVDVREALLDGCRCVAHSIIDQNSSANVSECYKWLYDAGLAEGFYGFDSCIASGVVSKAAAMCEASKVAINGGNLQATLICAGHLHGRKLRKFVGGE